MKRAYENNRTVIVFCGPTGSACLLFTLGYWLWNGLTEKTITMFLISACALGMYAKAKIENNILEKYHPPIKHDD